MEVSLSADDAVILRTDRSLRGCQSKLQPTLDATDVWTEQPMVLPSISRCYIAYLSLDPKEMGGKVAPVVTLRGETLKHEPRPTLLAVTHWCHFNHMTSF